MDFRDPRNFLPIGSWLIRWWLKTPYSHVYLKFHSESIDRTLIYEAVGVGVRFMGNKAWSSHALEVDYFDISISDESYKLILQYCIDMAGTEYGYMQNLGVVISNLLSLDYNLFKSGKNCSELILEMLKLEGYESLINPDLATPKDIFNILKSDRLF